VRGRCGRGAGVARSNAAFRAAAAAMDAMQTPVPLLMSRTPQSLIWPRGNDNKQSEGMQ